MDEKASIAELKSKVKKFCEARDWDQFHNPKDLAIGIITESSELLEHFRFKSDIEMKAILESKKKEEISDEIADIMFFILRFAQMNNIDLSAELERKLAISEKKYPVEKAKGSNKKYTEL